MRFLSKHVGMTSPAPLRGFTLIELLVVVAIIALLVSILLPSLAKAKDLAKQVVCQTNLRSIGVLTSLYMSDFNNIIPGMPDNLAGINTNAEFEQSWQYKLMEMNEGDGGVFNCPSNDTKNLGQASLTYGYSNYCMNAYYVHSRSDIGVEKPILGGPGLGISASEILLLVDSTCTYMYVWASDASWHYATVHDDNKGANVLNLDLHVDGPAPGIKYANGEGKVPGNIYPNNFY